MTSTTAVITDTSTFEYVSQQARWALHGYPSTTLPADDTLLTRGGGSATGLQIYDELERDPKVWEVVQKRKLGLVARNWRVQAASTSRRDQAAAALVSAQFQNIGFDDLTNNLLDATLKGISAGEIMWERYGSEIVASEFLPMQPWLLRFAPQPEEDDTIFARHGVRLICTENMLQGRKVPSCKFLIHRFGGKYNNPWGLGLGTRLFWPVFFKRQGIQFWLSFAERFGTPVPVGKYPNNATSAEKSTLRAALRAFAQEAAIMVPQGMEIDLIEATRSGIDTYERLCRYMDDQIAGIVLGKSGGVGTGGQLAAAVSVENEVRLELIKGDADLLSDTMNRQLVRWIVDYNMPGAGYPELVRVIEEPKDKLALASTRRTLFNMGFRPTLESIRAEFGGEYTDMHAPKGKPTKTPDFGSPPQSSSSGIVDL
ncbi:DUF935 family protein [Herbaspirillum sp. HC18]|nr:DUF935 family protein [Herbaspirillum sp. HC18]